MNHPSRKALALGAVLLATAAAAASAARQRQPAESPMASDAAQVGQTERIAVYRSPG